MHSPIFLNPNMKQPLFGLYAGRADVIPFEADLCSFTAIFSSTLVSSIVTLERKYEELWKSDVSSWDTDNSEPLQEKTRRKQTLTNLEANVTDTQAKNTMKVNNENKQVRGN